MNRVRRHIARLSLNQRAAAAAAAAAIFLFLLFSSAAFADQGSTYQPTAKGSQGGTLAAPGSGDNFLFTGSFLYSYPIEVPPGIAGMEPELSLQYNSSGGNGWLGVGWDLSLGSIQRSTKNGPPLYTDDDVFLFTINGQSQELVKLPDGTYRAKIEGAFQKFLKQGDAWTVYDKSGTRFFFGWGPDRKITTPSGTFQWALHQVVDRNGNNMTISYITDHFMLYPAEINYTSNLTTNRFMDRKVIFTLETRPDISTSFRIKAEQRQEKRLSKIETQVKDGANWRLVRRYQLNYAVSSGRIKSELQSIQTTGFNGNEQIALPPTLFQTAVTETNWNEQPPGNSYELPDDLIAVTSTNTDTFNPSLSRDNGLRLVELNGDGRIDLIQSINGAGQVLERRRAWLNTSTGWVDATSAWFPPDYFTLVDWTGDGNWTSWRENGIRFSDVNSDGLTDMVQGVGIGNSVIARTYLNTGSGWSESPTWKLPSINGQPIHFSVVGGAWSRDNGLQFVELNGDGRPDLLQSLLMKDSQTPIQHAWINTGSGWVQDDSRNVPQYNTIVFGGGLSSRPNGTIMADFNGDGLTDQGISLLFTNTSQWTNQVWLNNGAGWTLMGDDWDFPLPYTLAHDGQEWARDNGVELADINGDGLVDWVQAIKSAPGGGGDTANVSLNNGHGWQNVTANWTPPHFSIMNDPLNGFHYYSTGYTLADIDGDGLSDLVRGWSNFENSETARFTGLGRSYPQLMTQTTNPLGGSKHLTYDFTPRLSGDHHIPFPLAVLTQMESNDGRGTSVPVTYSYFGGYYDPTEREFLGFASVESIDAEGNRSKSYFHQNLDPFGQPAPVNAFKGRVYKTERTSASGQLLTTDETRWERAEPWPGVHFVRAQWTQQTLNDIYPNQATQVQYTYDDAPSGPGYGNVIRTTYLGDLNTNGDERSQLTEYAENTDLYLLGFPKRSTLLGPQEEILSDSLIYYDGSNTLGQITKGNVTKASKWRNLPTEKWIDATMEMNDYGQVTRVEDSYHHPVITTYDSFGYPASVTNALGHTVQSVYDLGTGNVLTDTDPNNQTTTHRYDALGRETKVFGPLDSETYPTVETLYHDELLGNPSSQYVETLAREKHGDSGTLWKKTYVDGLGRSFKSESEAENGTWTLSETEFNTRGLAWRTSVPRLNTPPSDPQWTERHFDALGRVTQVIRPDQSVTTTQYLGRMTNVQDDNGKIQTSVADAYGRLIQRYEPSIPIPTIYEYDNAGNLERVTDSQGYTTTFVYDSLNRKLSMQDPNAGTWSYSYDDNGNLMDQTDARGVQLSFQYDSLNRILTKTLQADPSGATGQIVGSELAHYTYDEVDAQRPYSKGRLTTVQDPSGTERFFHDKLGRVIRDVKQVDALEYEVESAYDALSRATQLTYPSDRVINYFYNGAGRLDRVTNNNQSVVYASYPSYTALGQPLLLNQATGATRTTYTYDPLQHLLGSIKTEKVSPPQTYQEMHYLFDGVGNLQTITDTAHPERNQNFVYDDLYRLTFSTGVYGQQSFTYDDLGNFETMAGSAYHYNDPHHPYAVTEITAEGQFAKDDSTLLAWNLDPSEPIYSVSGNITGSLGQEANGVPVYLSGAFGQGLLSDLNLNSSENGYYEFRGLAGGLDGHYSLSVSSAGMISNPAGYAFNPLTQNETLLDFSLSPDPSPPLDPSKLRIPRTAVAGGAPLPNLNDGSYSGGLIGGAGFGGKFLSGANGWSAVSGYSAMPDPADTIYHPPNQYTPPPGTLGSGIVGPRFVAGRYQQGMEFNGISDIFIFPESDTHAPSSLTLMLWVHPSTYPTYGFATLIAKSSPTLVGQTVDGFRLALNAQGHVQFELGQPGGLANLLTSEAPLPVNEWTFVSATYDGVQMKLYFDDTPNGAVAANEPVIPNQEPMTIGAGLDANRHLTPGTFYQGELDEPRLHNRAWSEAEIIDALIDFDVSAIFAYDENGNEIEKSAQGSDWTYQFDADGRLAQINQDGQPHTTFLYDESGARVKKITYSGPDAGTTLYIGKLFEIRPSGGGGTTSVDHVFAGPGGAGGQLICDIVQSGASGGTASGNPKSFETASPAQSTVYYYHTDQLGSTTLVTLEDGSLTQEYTYEPFGKIHSVSGSSPAKHKYTQQEDDGGTGLYFYNARYYDPEIARFVSADSLVPSALDPQSLNRYAYVRNNPMILTDPSGQSWLSDSIHKAGNWISSHSEAAGLAVQFLTGNMSFGVPLLARSESGRNILAAEIVGITGLAAIGMASPIFTGAAWGSAGGVYSAHQSDGELLNGAIFGAIVGGVSAYYGAKVGLLEESVSGYVDPSSGALITEPSVSEITRDAVFHTLAKSAIQGAGTGMINSYAGGRGDINTIIDGTISGAFSSVLIDGLVIGGSAIAYKSGLANLKNQRFSGTANLKDPFSDDMRINGKIGFAGSINIGRIPLINGKAMGDFSGGMVRGTPYGVFVGQSQFDVGPINYLKYLIH